MSQTLALDPAVGVAAPDVRSDRAVGRFVRPTIIGLVMLALAVVIAINFSSIWSTVTAAVAQAATASPIWLAGAAGLTVASMVAFGDLRQRTLRAAGARMPLREAVSVSYAAAAIHVTTPGGGVLSTAYVFRRLQRDGVRPSAITWSLAISGVLSTLTLAALGAVGLATGQSGSWTGLLSGLGLSLVLGLAVAVAAKYPDRLIRSAERLLRLLNRILRRPEETGLITLHATLADLRAIRPSGFDWAVASAVAAANWLLDLLCLWACAHALGLTVAPWMLLSAYTLAMFGASVSPLPAGAGIVDGILVLALTASGAAGSAAVGAVLLYRVLSFGTLLAVGWGAVGLHSLPGRAHRGAEPAAG